MLQFYDYYISLEKNSDETCKLVDNIENSSFLTKLKQNYGDDKYTKILYASFLVFMFSNI